MQWSDFQLHGKSAAASRSDLAVQQELNCGPGADRGQVAYSLGALCSWRRDPEGNRTAALETQRPYGNHADPGIKGPERNTPYCTPELYAESFESQVMVWQPIR